MTIKKISKDQPDNFEFNNSNLDLSKKIIQKDGTSGHWKKLIKHKTCSFCTNEAMHYEKFKYYCKHCYKEKLNGK